MQVAGAVGHDLAVTSDGALFVVGDFSGKVEFGVAQSERTTLSTPTEHDSDGFVAKYDASGELAWARRFGGAQSDSAIGVAAVGDQGVLVMGRVLGDASFAAAANDAYTAHSGATPEVSFLARYSANGELSWISRFGGMGEQLEDLAALPDGSAVITGSFRGTLRFGSSPQVELTSAGASDIFVVRYAPDGEPQWAARAGSPNDLEGGRAVILLADGSALLTGSFMGRAEFGGGTTLSSAGGQDFFLAKYSQTGALVWARRAGGEGSDVGLGIAANHTGGVLVTGKESVPNISDRTLPFRTPGRAQAVLWWFDAVGALAGSETIVEAEANSTGVAVVPTLEGGFGVAGKFTGHAAIAHHPLTGTGGEDVYLASYDAPGSVRWAIRIGGSKAGLDTGLAALSDGSLLVTGTVDQGATLQAGSTRLPLEPGLYLSRLAR